MLDPWVALSAIAVATNQIRIGTLVTPVARRRPWKLARETVTLDHLSGGRLILVVGLGSPPDEEFEQLGEERDDHARARRLDEGLEVLTGLWSGEPFTFDGAEFHVKNVTFKPRPLQQPRIPIWVAGMWPHHAPFRRAARWDGVCPMMEQVTPGTFTYPTPVDIQAIVSYVQQHRDSSESFDVTVGVQLPTDPAQARDTIAAFDAAGTTWLLDSAGGPNDLLARLRRGPPP